LHAVTGVAREPYNHIIFLNDCQSFSHDEFFLFLLLLHLNNNQFEGAKFNNRLI
jgi:hypothetical protein